MVRLLSLADGAHCSPRATAADSLLSLRFFVMPLRQPSLPCVPILILMPLKGDQIEQARTHWHDVAMFPSGECY